MIEVNGKTVYACITRLQPREMTLAPLSNKKLVRDLVTEIAPPAERFAECSPLANIHTLCARESLAKPLSTRGTLILIESGLN